MAAVTAIAELWYCIASLQRQTCHRVATLAHWCRTPTAPCFSGSTWRGILFRRMRVGHCLLFLPTAKGTRRSAVSSFASYYLPLGSRLDLHAQIGKCVGQDIQLALQIEQGAVDACLFCPVPAVLPKGSAQDQVGYAKSISMHVSSLRPHCAPPNCIYQPSRKGSCAAC